jgi:hypothetical protein
MSRGLNVPAEDLETCREIDKEVMDTYLMNTDIRTTTNPAYGTAEFWKLHWQKKKAAAANTSTSNAVSALVKDISQICISNTHANPGFKFKPKVSNMAT